jgi:hypothetical protein
MNLEHLTKNVGCRVQLVPVACRLDSYGRELPEIDDDWILQRVTPLGADISNTRTGHVTTLGKDHIHHFTSNTDRSQAGLTHGFLILNVQLFLQGKDIRIKPNGRPGEVVKFSVPEIHEKWVDLRYPTDSGVQQQLESAGYRVAWSLDTHLTRRVDLEGWEVVVEPDAQGRLWKFMVKDRPANHTLIKKRNA